MGPHPSPLEWLTNSDITPPTPELMQVTLAVGPHTDRSHWQYCWTYAGDEKGRQGKHFPYMAFESYHRLAGGRYMPGCMQTSEAVVPWQQGPAHLPTCVLAVPEAIPLCHAAADGLQIAVESGTGVHQIDRVESSRQIRCCGPPDSTQLT